MIELKESPGVLIPDPPPHDDTAQDLPRRASGRPQGYSDEDGGQHLLSQEMLDWICQSAAIGAHLSELARIAGIKYYSILYMASDEASPVYPQFRRARVARLYHYADQLISLADQATSSKDAPAAKLKVETRQWLLGRLLPKDYGYKSGQSVSGTINLDVSKALDQIAERQAERLDHRPELISAPAGGKSGTTD